MGVLAGEALVGNGSSGKLGDKHFWREILMLARKEVVNMMSL